MRVPFSNTRRALVLTDETARHPFLASLPPHVRELLPADPEAASPWSLTRADMRRFAANYCAGFAAVLVFIS